MTHKEILEAVAATESFINITNDDYMALLNELEATSNRLTLAYALHFAYLVGYKQANQTMLNKSSSGIEWSDSFIALGLSMLDD